MAIQNGRRLTLKTHRMTDQVEKHILYALETILTKTRHEKLIHAVYTILKELATNGCKANQKRIYFEESGLDMNDNAEYLQGVRGYRSLFSERMALEYGIKARDLGLYVLIDFQFTEEGIRIEVLNNTPYSVREEEKIRDIMKRAMGYTDIAEFYMDQLVSEEAGEIEGAGLGIALIVILLRGEGIDPNLFRIMKKEQHTLARVEIPFSESFATKRDVP